MKSNRLHLLVAAMVSILTLAAFWQSTEGISQKFIWFSNLDQDSSLLFESLRVNDGKEPNYLDHPGLGAYMFLGLAQKAMVSIGVQDFSSLSEFFDRPDPILELPGFYYRNITVNKVMIMGLALFLALGLFFFTRSVVAALLVPALVLSLEGLLFNSLLLRTDTIAVFFLAVAFCGQGLAYRAANEPKSRGLYSWLYLAGVAMGVAVLTKVMVVPVLLPLLLVGAYILWTAPKNQVKPSLWLSGFMVMALGFVFWYFLWVLEPLTIAEVHLKKLLFLLAGVGAVSFVVQKYAPRLGLVLQGGVLQMTGYLAATPLTFWYANFNDPYYKYYTIRAVFSANRASSGEFVNNAFNWQGYLGHVNSFFMQSISGSLMLAVGLVLLGLCRSQRRRLAVLFLLGTGFGMSLVSSLRYYSFIYLAYTEVFYALACSVGFYDLYCRMQKSAWARPLILGLVAALVAYVFPGNLARVQDSFPQYNGMLRDRVENVAECIYRVADFEAGMKKIYGPKEQIMARIILDDRLNGSRRGIDIMSLPNVIKGLNTHTVDLVNHPYAQKKPDLSRQHQAKDAL